LGKFCCHAVEKRVFPYPVCMRKDKIYQTVILYVVLNGNEESEGTELRASIRPKGKDVLYEELHKMRCFRIVTFRTYSCAVYYEITQSRFGDTCSMYGRAKKNSVHLFG
jgi:hypothetical protein